MELAEVARVLERRGFSARFFHTAAEAADYLDGAIDGQTVSFGGSLTLEAMGLKERLSRHNRIYQPLRIADGVVQDQDVEKAATSDVFVTSVNALAETGELVSIDGLGNRVSSMLYGHRRAYFVVGRNKLEPTFEKAVWRARNIAAPRNAARLARKTPCAVSGRCHDCNSPERICRGMAVLFAPILRCEMEVVLVDEKLGL